MVNKFLNVKTFLLPLFLIILLFTRLYVLSTQGWQFYQFEGLHRGYMAEALLCGADWKSIFNNPALPAEGGSVIVGYLAALFFSMFGDSFFSLVLVSVFFTLLILICFFLLLERHFNRYAAVIFSILFIFPPTNCYRFSMYALGLHAESVLFSVLGLFCFFEIFFKEDNYNRYQLHAVSRKVSFLFLLFGFISGFGIYFNYQYLIMLLALICSWFLLDRKIFFKIYFYIFSTGLTIGLLPWIIYNATHYFSGLKVHDLTISQILFSNTPSSICAILGRVIIGLAGRNNLGLLLYFLILTSFSTLILLKQSSYIQTCKKLILRDSPDVQLVPDLKSLILLVYIFLFFFVWSILYMPLGRHFSPFQSGENSRIDYLLFGLWARFNHIYPFLFALTAISIINLVPRKKESLYVIKAMTVAIFSTLVLIVGAFNYYHLLNTPNPNKIKINPLILKGFSARFTYSRRDERISNFLDSDLVLVSRAAQFDSRLWQIFSSRLSNSLGQATAKTLNEISNNSLIEGAKKPLYYLLLGLNFGDYLEGYNVSIINEIVAMLTTEESKQFFYEGVAISLMRRNTKEVVKNINFINRVPNEYRHYFLMDVGRLIAFNLNNGKGKDILRSAETRFNQNDLIYIYQGIIRSIVADAAKKVPAEYEGKIYLSKIYSSVTSQLATLKQNNKFSTWFQEKDINEKIEEYAIYSVIAGYFKDCNFYDVKKTKETIDSVIRHNWIKPDIFYMSLGFVLGHFTLGESEAFKDCINSSVKDEYSLYVYRGFDLSREERYGSRL